MTRVEQVRAHGGAQARQARARDPAEEHDHRHPFACRGAAGRRVRRSRISTCRPFRSRTSPRPRPRRSARKQEADIRTRITGYDERLADLDAMGLDMQLVMPPPQPVLLHGAARHRRARRAAWSMTASPNTSPASRTASSRFGTRAAAGRQRGREGARALHEQARLQGRADPHQCGRQGAVRSAPTRRSGRRPRSSARSCSSIRTASPKGKRLSRFYFNNVIGNPFETTLALHYLIFDGVLERHPNLKILAVHGGGYLRRLFGPHRPRLGRALGLRRPTCRSRRPAT